MVINYAKTNVGLDGRPLTEQQWVRERHAELAIEIEAAQLIQDMTASKVAADVKVGIETSVVKAHCTDLERGICCIRVGTRRSRGAIDVVHRRAPVRGGAELPLAATRWR